MLDEEVRGENDQESTPVEADNDNCTTNYAENNASRVRVTSESSYNYRPESLNNVPVKRLLSDLIDSIASREHMSELGLDEQLAPVYRLIAQLPEGEDSALLRQIRNRFAELVPDDFALRRKITLLRDDLGKQLTNQGSLKMLSLDELLTHEFPPRNYLLEPWLREQSLAMLFAKRGVGKTHVGLGIAYAVASGGHFLRWSASEPNRVCYVDGEMPGSAIQERLANIHKSSGGTVPEGFLQIITPDLQENSMPDLCSSDGQALLNKVIPPETKLIVFDNLSSLARTGKENEGESWLPIQNFCLEHRRQGRSVLLIHHAGKNGTQRGSSRREDLLDEVIELVRPGDSDATNGATFEVHFRKSREFYGESGRPFMAKLNSDGDAQNWQIDDISDEVENESELIEFYMAGVSGAEIARKLGVNKSTISRRLGKLKSQGKIL